MNLGERIYNLRTERGLSQGDLAEKLEVSRQSVSKWENNNAMPDIEKIIKLGELFGVSLDELVKGEETLQNLERGTTASPDRTGETGLPPRKIAGTILLCMAFLVVMFFLLAGGGLAGLIFASPFFVCGILCFAVKKNVGLWCAWAVYVLFDIYMAYATGISRASVLYTFRWTYQMNYMRLAFAWVMVVSLGIIIAVTVVRLGKKPLVSKEKGYRQLVFAWIGLIVLQALAMLWGYSGVYQHLINNILTMGAVLQLSSIMISWSKIIVFTVALVVTARFLRMKKENSGRE